jgi:hypothetical protein
VNLHLTRPEISHIAGDPEPFRSLKREIAIPNALHTPANEIMFRANHKVFKCRALRQKYWWHTAFGGSLKPLGRSAHINALQFTMAEQGMFI